MANEITYDDKIGVNPRKTHVNQVWDADMNEIKNAHNLDSDRIDALSNQKTRIISGGMVWVSGLIYESVDLVYEINGNEFTISDGSQLTLSTADASNPRIDVIYGDDNGTIAIEEGTPLATPVKPSINEVYQLELTFATVSALATEPDGVGIDTLYLEDVGQPTEWDATDNTGGLRIDTADTTTPITGAKSIRTIDTLVNNDSFTLTNATAVNVAEFNYLRINIKLPNSWSDTEKLTIVLKSGSTEVAKHVYGKKEIVRNIYTLQTVTIFNDAFGSFNGTSFDNIEFVARAKGTLQFQIDDISISTSDVIVSPTNIQALDVALDTSNFDTNLDTTITDVQKLADAVDDLVLGGSTKEVLNYSIYDESSSGRVFEKWCEKIEVFNNAESVGGVDYDTFRIPAVKYMPNGDLLAFCEARVSGWDDNIPADILLARLRGDSILSKEILIAREPAEYILRTPNVVLDGSRVYVFFTAFENDTAGTPNPTNHLRTYYIYSDDNGVSWSSRTEFLASDQDASSAFKWMTCPANGIVHSSGDIIIPIWGKYVNDSYPDYYRAGIVVWDGTTFTKRILEAEHNANEPTVYEDEEGNIVMSCRRSSTGLINRSTYYTPDKGVTWLLHQSDGASSSSVYVNIKKYGNELYRLEIDLEGVSVNRKNLRLYKTDLSNTNYEKIIDITPIGEINWGYGCSDYFIGNFAALSDGENTLDLYNVFIEDAGVLNIAKTEVVVINPDFSALMVTNGDDSVIPLTATNAGNVSFASSEYAEFDGTDNANLQYADNSVFDFSNGSNDLEFTISLKIKFDVITGSTNYLFLNKHGASGTNRTWGIRMSAGLLRVLLYSELNSSNIIYYESDIQPVSGVEYKIDVLYDGAGNLKLYINGNLSGVQGSVGATFVKLGQSTNTVTAGRLLSSSSFNFDGYIKDLKVFKGVQLSAAQRAAL